MIRLCISFALIATTLVAHAQSLKGEYKENKEKELYEKVEINNLKDLMSQVIQTKNKLYCTSRDNRFFLDYYNASRNIPDGVALSIIGEKVYLCAKYDLRGCWDNLFDITSGFPKGLILDESQSKWKYEYDKDSRSLYIKYLQGYIPLASEDEGIVERLSCSRTSEEVDLRAKSKTSPLDVMR
jgi:hypothetical protein